MKETVTQSSFSENINWKNYVVSITKCGNGYQIQLQMKTQLNNISYDDVKLVVVDLFNRFRMDMSNKVVDNKWTTVKLWTTEDQPKKRWWPKWKKRTGQANLWGRPRKNTIVATSDDVKNKAKKKLSDNDFFNNLPKDNTFSELGIRDYKFNWYKWR